MTPTSLTVRTPDDLLACVPLLLGFLPQRSAVVVSLPPGSGPHARADILDDTDLSELADGLLDPLLRHGVRRVAVVTYADLDRARWVGAHLAEVFGAAGVEVAAAVAADGSHWVSVTPPTTVPREYDAMSHPFVAEAVVGGQVVLGSREALRDQLRPDPAFCGEVGRRRADVADRLDSGVDAAWVLECLDGHLREHTLPDAAEVARLCLGVAHQDGRDAAWGWVERSDARQHVEIWLRVLRGCPPDERAAPAAVLAFHAWLAGDGALAWCAVEVSQASGETCSLARLVEDLLTRAAPPALWQPLLEGPHRGGSAGRDRSGHDVA